MRDTKYSDIYDASRQVASKLEHIRTIVDMGSRHGEGYDRFGVHFPNAEYIFVEPSPRCVPHIIEKQRTIAGRTRLVDAVVGKKAGSAEFFLLERDGDQSGNMYTDRGGTYGQSVVVNVPVISCDDFLRSVGHIDFLKCNIEGGEYELLETSLFDNVSAFVMEAHNRHVPGKTYMDVIQSLEHKFDMEVWGDRSYKYCFINAVRRP